MFDLGWVSCESMEAMCTAGEGLCVRAYRTSSTEAYGMRGRLGNFGAALGRSFKARWPDAQVSLQGHEQPLSHTDVSDRKSCYMDQITAHSMSVERHFPA